MSGVAWSAAGLGALAVWLLLSRVVVPLAPEPDAPGTSAGASAERAALLRWRPLLTLVGGAGGWALVGGRYAVVAALVCAVAVWVVLGRTEDPALARRRARLATDLPVGVDLLAACLDVGAAPGAALVTVAEALGGPVGEELRGIHHRLAIGVPPAEVWQGVARHPQLGPLGRAVGRAHESGASVGQAVHRLAEELRETSRAEVEARARSIEVRAAAPLGLCLLPAFMLLGVVPMVVGVFASMQLFR